MSAEADFVRDPKLNIYQRLHAVMGEIVYIQKDKKAGMQYSIVSHDKVTGLVRPLMHKHGVIYFISHLTPGQDGNRTSAKIHVTFANVDNPMDQFTAESFGYGVDPGDKGPGKAMSYAVKYALLKTLGLETGDHPDVSGDPDEVQDERANYRSFDTPPIPTTGISPKDFASVKGDPSSAQSGRSYLMLEPEMKANKTASELTDWWIDNQDEIKSMHTNGRWEFFEQMIEYGLSLCTKPLSVNLFWSNHLSALNILKKAMREKYECLEEMMITRAARLADPEAKVEFANAR